MSYYLFLDDARHPRNVNWVTLPENVPWVIARSYEDFVGVLDKMGLPKYVAYDCDLCEDHYNAFFELKHNYVIKYHEFKTKCGIHCLEHLLKRCKAANVKHPEYVCHTRNHYAKVFMDEMISKFNAASELPNSDESELIPTPLPTYAEHTQDMISGFFGKYRWLSNFWPAEVSWMKVKYPSVEVAYQAAKCAIPADRDKFLTASSAEAKALGKKIIIRSDWESVRYEVMSQLVFQKFSDHPELKAKLKATGDAMLIEANSWKDKFWGVAYQFNRDTHKYECVGGQNALGTILMEVRSKL